MQTFQKSGLICNDLRFAEARIREVGLAFAEIVLLWFAIAATLAAFCSVSRAAVWLLVPYLAWVSFAAVLNLSLWRLNS